MGEQEAGTPDGAGAKGSRKSALGLKFALLATLPALAAAVLAGIALAWTEASDEAALHRDRLTASASMAAASAAEAVAAGDKVRAQATLSAILGVPSVSYARIERPYGAPWIEAAANSKAMADGRVAADVVRPASGPEWQGRTAAISVPIAFGGRPVGQVVVMTRTPGAADNLAASLGLALSAAAPPPCWA